MGASPLLTSRRSGNGELALTLHRDAERWPLVPGADPWRTTSMFRVTFLLHFLNWRILVQPGLPLLTKYVNMRVVHCPQEKTKVRPMLSSSSDEDEEEASSDDVAIDEDYIAFDELTSFYLEGAPQPTQPTQYELCPTCAQKTK
uniref:Uncharacterized protein n=1 Tax=Leersia perrieri TaxID=77586 RepID=A0A0D9VVP0_9ORYZ